MNNRVIQGRQSCLCA